MKGFLVRVGIDSTYGHWNAPVDTDTGQFVYVTIPETQLVRPGLERRYTEVVPFSANIGVTLPSHLSGELTHLDPDFEYLTYGDGGSKGKRITELQNGDFIVFYAGLKSISPNANSLIYGLIGFYVVKEIVAASIITPDHFKENAHTRRQEISDDIVVRAKHGVSGRLSKCVSIGEYRDRAYRVRKDILEAWGGLSVGDGFIQRSKNIPHFLKPERFLAWFEGQKPELISRNN